MVAEDRFLRRGGSADLVVGEVSWTVEVADVERAVPAVWGVRVLEGVWEQSRAPGVLVIEGSRLPHPAVLTT
ncbi:hypothetical protein [Thermoflexus sp.]|uniref:hypothetical protein n=1 Tax=Thermoflexus sp. TaxID=1969742 RepID=UPI003332C8B9